MKHSLLFLAGSLLLVGTAHAQATFSVGPRVGLNVATAHFADEAPDISHTSRPGLEAGLMGNLQLGRWALQPSVLFSQKGYHKTSPAFGLAIYGPVTYDEIVRLNYLTVPLNVAYSLGHDGQGLQVFGGPYAGLLLGGQYTFQRHTSGYPALDTELTRKVKPGDTFSDTENQYSQRVDYGLQAGAGYRLGGLLLQASYTLGLRNLATEYDGNLTVYYPTPAYYNRGFQVSLSYLLGIKS